MLTKTISNSLKVMLVIFSFVLFNGASYSQDNTRTNTSEHTGKKKSKADFKPEAERLSNDLMKKVGFSQDKADDIRDILIRYNKEIVDARREYYKAENENRSKITDSVKDRREGTTGYDEGFIYFKDLPPELSKVYKDADRKANDDIVSKLSQDEEKKYDKVKKNWWNEVHNAVSSHNMGKGKNSKQMKNK